jgi:hypothetical protein
MTTTPTLLRQRHQPPPSFGLYALHLGAMAVGGWYALTTLLDLWTRIGAIFARLAS